MSHPLYWPSKLFFYPIGNTAAVSLTRDLSPEQSADILLLGCGDPRNILYTLYADVTVDTGALVTCLLAAANLQNIYKSCTKDGHYLLRP